MQFIENKRFGEERALYMLRDAVVEHCRFEGEEDGESFLKESENIVVRSSYMDLRYPMWHAKNLLVEGCEMTERCRAALWYDSALTVKKTAMNGIKAVRECEDVLLDEVKAVSPEFGWRCKNFRVEKSEIQSEYAFFECEDLSFVNSVLEGKYSFQYVKNLTVENSNLKTKDAFWHSKNATVRDCDIDGEYLGWYSNGLTLINCHIRGTQPLCYCARLRLIDCTMEGCDLAFEYSDVEAEIIGTIDSVKNPRNGKIIADGFGDIIREKSKYPVKADLILRKGTT